MGRIRTIKPEFPQSQKIGRLSRDARLLFIQLWTVVDDSGRFRGASRMLASLLYPYDDDAPKLVNQWLEELEQVHSIRRYSVDGDDYIDIPKWLEHQKIDRPSASKFPSFDEGSRAIDDASRTLALARASSRTKDQGPKDLDQVSAAGAIIVSRYTEFYAVFPKKKDPRLAEKAYMAASKRADPEIIIQGAKRYAIERSGQDARYTKAPTAWLNADAWLNEPESMEKDLLNGRRTGTAPGTPHNQPSASKNGFVEYIARQRTLSGGQ